MRLIALFAFATALWAQATGSVTLTWDPMPAGQTWKAIRIYEVNGTTYTQVAEVGPDQTSVRINAVPGRHDYVARSVDGWESDDSNVASTPAKPNSPGNTKAQAGK